MGLRAGALLLFPLAVMFMFILSAASAPTIAGGGDQTFCNPNNPTQCNSTTTGATTYYCNPSLAGTFVYCKILPNCNVEPPPGSNAYCVHTLLEAFYYQCSLEFATSGHAGCPVILPAGAFATLGATTINANLATTGAFFSFSITATSGFVVMIGVAVGLISLASLSVFGSSAVSTESAHLLYIAGLLLGIWAILSGLEGFVGGSPTSMFTQLNGFFSGAGTGLYVVLTLMYTVGIIGASSRGS